MTIKKPTASNNILLSVCVPTYNREALLKKMFDSIGFAYLDNIEIVLVDDGSEDSTKELCKEYKNKYNLKYIYQENLGRSHALRLSILNASGSYVIIMDSDDEFIKNGISTIVQSLLESSNYISEKNIAGMVFLCCDENYNVLGKSFNCEKGRGNIIRDLADFNIYGDKKEVIKLDILKKFMYTPYESEKRMATSVLWNRISNEFDVINVNKIVAMKIYCDDGLGKNIDYVRMLSCKSSSLFYSETLNSHGIVYSSYRYAFRMSINLIRYSIHSKSLEFIRKVNLNASNLSLLLSATPFGLYLYLQDKYKYIARR